ncbi:MAG: DUF6398 domain-containing protein [Campylobacterota bacterium]|nr:DUF6398 domain-containing protein [Campylobacterota bacterium]
MSSGDLLAIFGRYIEAEITIYGELLKQNKSENVPKIMEDKYLEIINLTDSFSKDILNEEYAQYIRYVIAALCRKRPSPLSKGKAKTWACGAVHAVGTVNFLFDRSQSIHISVSELYEKFDIAKSTGQSKSKIIRDLLKMDYMNHHWTLPSKLEDNPMVWMLSINGMIMDVRDLPIEVQEQALEQGLIPYIPGKSIQ